MEINILDLSEHYSIKMATSQGKDLQPDGSTECKKPQSTLLCAILKARTTKDLRTNYIKGTYSCLYSSSCQYFQTREEKPHTPLKNTAIATATLKQVKLRQENRKLPKKLF